VSQGTVIPLETGALKELAHYAQEFADETAEFEMPTELELRQFLSIVASLSREVLDLRERCEALLTEDLKKSLRESTLLRLLEEAVSLIQDGVTTRSGKAYEEKLVFIRQYQEFVADSAWR
jgi:hypothetical protein